MKAAPDSETHWGWYAAATVPFAATVAFVLALGVDMPLVDEWNMIPVIASTYDGHFPIQEVWQPHNEHIAVYPHVVILSLAQLTRWNLRVQMLATLAFMGGALVFLLRMLRGAGLPPWSLPLGSCFLFSLHAYENWLWACQIHIGIAVFGVVGALSLLGADPARKRTIALAAVLANVGSWSFLNAFLVWPFGFLVLLLRPFPSRRDRILALAIWAGGFLVTAGLPLKNLVGRQSGVFPQWSTPVATLFDFASLYLGAGLVGRLTDHVVQRVAGGIGQAMVAIGALLVAFRRRASGAALALAALGLFGIASGYMIAGGRALYAGVGTAVASRYATYSGLSWIFALVLPALSGNGRGRAGRTACAAFAMIGLAVLLGTQGQDVASGSELSEQRRAAAVAFRSGEGISWNVVKAACGDPQWMSPYLCGHLDNLRRHRLSFFRHASGDELDPPKLEGLPEVTLEITNGPGKQVGRWEAHGGLPGNLAFGIVAIATAAAPDLLPQGDPDGPPSFDQKGDVSLVYDVVPNTIPKEGARFYVFSFDRRGRVIQSAPGRIVFR